MPGGNQLLRCHHRGTHADDTDQRAVRRSGPSLDHPEIILLKSSDLIPITLDLTLAASTPRISKPPTHSVRHERAVVECRRCCLVATSSCHCRQGVVLMAIRSRPVDRCVTSKLRRPISVETGQLEGNPVDAALTIGVVATVLVPATGILVGSMTTRQANRRLQQEHAVEVARRRQEHQDEEARLRLDAAMKAGALFSSNDGRPTDPAAVASGLLALTRLNHTYLAVTLLVDLWSGKDSQEQRVKHETAVLVINEALKATSTPNAQLVAAELLCRNASRLDPTQSLHWPSVIDGCWDEQFGPKTKMLLLDGLVRMTLASNVSEEAVRSVAMRLYGVWRRDHNARVRGCVGRLIKAVFPALEGLGYTVFLGGTEEVTLRQLKEAADSGTNNPDDLLNRIVGDRCKCLRTWSADCKRSVVANVCLVAAS